MSDTTNTPEKADKRSRRLLKRARKSKRGGTTRRAPVGAPPGTLIADPDAHEPRLTLNLLAEDGRHEVHHSVSIDDLPKLREGWSKIWLDCTGLADTGLVERIGEMFGFHPLELEDVLNTGQRPKSELHEHHVFVVLHMLNIMEKNDFRHREQVSIFFDRDFVVTFQERPGDVFDPVRKRIEAGGKRLFARDADYLAYALIDAIVDGYFPMLEDRGSEIDRLEEEVLAETDEQQLTRLYEIRREVRHLQRALWPMRDAVAALVRTDSGLVHEETQRFLNDTQDHAIQLIEMNDNSRDTLTGLIELHMSLASARTNEVVNLLTIVSTIFIPLGVLVGVWGMNFDPSVSPWNMPELGFYFGYPMAIGIMLLIAIGLLWYFRRKRWI